MVPLYYQYFVQYWLVVRGDHDFDPGVMPPSFEEARRLLSWFTSDDFARRRMRSVLADDFHCHDLFRYDDNQVLDMLANHIACGRAQIYKEELERPALSPALPAKPPEKRKEVQAKEETTWIEVLLVDEQDKPVPGRPYRVAKVGGKPIGSGSLDSQGFVHLDTRLFGECVIQFPDIDQSAIRESYKTSPPPPSKPKPAPQEQSADTEESEIDDTDLLDEDLIKSFWEDEEPAVEEEESQPEGMTESAGDGNHVVQQGECLASIAYETGFLPDTIWKHGRNKALREVRKDPNALLPGDRLAIPPLQPAQFRGTTGARHRYVLIGVPARLTVRLLDFDGRVFANEEYRLEIDGGPAMEGSTDENGEVKIPIPPNATSAKLTVLSTDYQTEIALGHLDPVDSISGIQARLKNLGYDCGPVDGKLGPKTKAALRAFQSQWTTAPSGVPDDQWRSR